MSRFTLAIGDPCPYDNYSMQDSFIDSSPQEEIKIAVENHSILTYSFLRNEPLKGQRYFSNENWTVYIGGEFIDYPSVPFKRIIEIIEKQNYSELKNFNGVFALIAINKKEEKYYIISDRKAQFPIYYYLQNETAIISSELAAFCRLMNNAELNEKWLYDYIVFHYPIGEETFLKGVKKLSHSEILIYCNRTKKIQLNKYSGLFRKKENLLKGKDGLEYAIDVISGRVPKYFEGSDNIACALTGGWDGRTNIALAPDKNKITTYTYGGKDCSDFIFSRKVIKDIKTKHFEIPFEDEFINELPNHIFNTVYLSSGTQPIVRSTLKHVYSKLAEFPIVVSGISYDGLFRGSIGGPSIISPKLIEAFKNGRRPDNFNEYRNIFIGINGEFTNQIVNKINWIENEFGDFQSSETHLLFGNYLCDTQNFLGEYKLAERYTTLRVPAWDYELIDLAFSIEQSTLNYSEFVKTRRGSQETMTLQASLISKFAHELINTPVKTHSPNSVLSSHSFFKLYSKYRRSIYEMNKIFMYRDQQPLEDWNSWLNKIHIKFVDELIFSKKSLIQIYFTMDYLSKIKIQRDYHVIGKLCTIEILLRLINNRWRKFW